MILFFIFDYAEKVYFEPPSLNSYISFVCVTYILRICLCYSFRSTPTFCRVIIYDLHRILEQPFFQDISLFLHLFPFNIRCWTFDVRCSFYYGIYPRHSVSSTVVLKSGSTRAGAAKSNPFSRSSVVGFPTKTSLWRLHLLQASSTSREHVGE